MRKRRAYLILGFVVIVLAGAFVVVFRREREPEYGGKRLSEWVMQLQTGGAQTAESRRAAHEAADAIRFLGTNAVPFLLKWMEYEEPAWKEKLYAIVNRTIRHAPPSWYLHDKRLSLRAGAASALVTLGPPAMTAIPKLTELMNAPKVDGRVSGAIFALSGIGPAAVPSLVTGLTNADPGVRTKICFFIALKNRDELAAVPVEKLMNLLKDPDVNVRAAARNAVRRVDPDALERAEQAK